MKSIKSLTLAVALSACAGGAVNQDAVVDTRSAIRGAEEAGAQQAPQAALHLELANEQLAQAMELRDDEPETANMLLERAEVDAELAVALAHENNVREEANQTRERIREQRDAHL